MLRLFGRRAIGCLERGDQDIRVLRSTCVCHIPTMQCIHELASARVRSVIAFISFAVAVTVTNQLAALEPAHAHRAVQCAAGRVGKQGRRRERSGYCRRGQSCVVEVSLCQPLGFESGLGRFWPRPCERGIERDVLLGTSPSAPCLEQQKRERLASCSHSSSPPPRSGECADMARAASAPIVLRLSK
jgi:hypothetical protein